MTPEVLAIFEARLSKEPMSGCWLWMGHISTVDLPAEAPARPAVLTDGSSEECLEAADRARVKAADRHLHVGPSAPLEWDRNAALRHRSSRPPKISLLPAWNPVSRAQRSVWLIPASLRASLSSLESEDWTKGYALPSEDDCVFWASVSGKPSPHPFSWPGWKTRAWSRLLFGAATSRTWILPRLLEWTSSQRVHRASPIASPENVGATQTRGIFGPRSFESSPPVAPPWCSSRTSQASLDGFDRSARNYAEWVSSLRLASSERAMSARRTVGRDSSCWPSATAQDSRSSGAAGYSTESGRHAGTTLTDAIREWPTPNLTNWPSNQGGGMGRVGPVRPSLDTLALDWATPAAHERAQTPRAVDDGIQLANQVSEWATPAVADVQGGRMTRSGAMSWELLLKGQAAAWSTPAARDGRGLGERKHTKGGRSLMADIEDQRWSTPNARDWKGPKVHGEARLIVTATLSGEAVVVTYRDFGCVQHTSHSSA